MTATEAIKKYFEDAFGRIVNNEIKMSVSNINTELLKSNKRYEQRLLNAAIEELEVERTGEVERYIYPSFYYDIVLDALGMKDGMGMKVVHSIGRPYLFKREQFINQKTT